MAPFNQIIDLHPVLWLIVTCYPSINSGMVSKFKDGARAASMGIESVEQDTEYTTMRCTYVDSYRGGNDVANSCWFWSVTEEVKDLIVKGWAETQFFDFYDKFWGDDSVACQIICQLTTACCTCPSGQVQNGEPVSLHPSLIDYNGRHIFCRGLRFSLR